MTIWNSFVEYIAISTSFLKKKKKVTKVSLHRLFGFLFLFRKLLTCRSCQK